MRTLNAAITTAINGDNVWPVRLVTIAIGDMTYRISDHYINVISGGNTFLANGNLLSISNVVNQTNSNNDSIEVSLGVIESAFRADIIAADATGGTVTIQRGLIDANTGALIAEPITIYTGIIFSVSISEGGEIELGGSQYQQVAFTASIDVRAVTFRLDENPGRFTNDASNRRVDSGDAAMEFVAGLNGRNVTFGGST